MTSTDKKKSRRNRPSWQITLFALPFILLGLAAFAAGLYPVAQHLRSLGWEAASGQTLDLEDVAGRRNIADSRTSRMEGGFSYHWHGRTLRSRQISFSVMRDNFDDGWRDMVSERLGEPGQAIQVWVNPAHPEEAVAIRDIRWIEVGLALLGAACFGFGGAALLWANLSGYRPDQPAAGRFSWPLVLVLLATSPIWATLALLLWRDAHQAWAAASMLPVLLALNGVRVGCSAYLDKRKTRSGTHD